MLILDYVLIRYIVAIDSILGLIEHFKRRSCHAGHLIPSSIRYLILEENIVAVVIMLT